MMMILVVSLPCDAMSRNLRAHPFPCRPALGQTQLLARKAREDNVKVAAEHLAILFLCGEDHRLLIEVLSQTTAGGRGGREGR